MCAGFEKFKVRQPHRYEWLWEALEADASFVLRSMFGAKAVYLDGKLMLCFCAEEEPWRGVLVCTDRSHHPALRIEFPSLSLHTILSKWLYLPEACGDFEASATRLVGLARQRDHRLGVGPRPKRRPAAIARRTGVRSKPRDSKKRR
jgi:hypothetical protein